MLDFLNWAFLGCHTCCGAAAVAVVVLVDTPGSVLAHAKVGAVSDAVSAAVASCLPGKSTVGGLPFKCLLMFHVLPPFIDISFFQY